MADNCGTFADSKTESELLFTTSANNAILMGARNTAICYSYQTVTTPEEHYGLVTSYVASPQDMSKMITVTTTQKYITYKTQTITSSHNLELYPYHIEAKGTLQLQWNDNGRLIATIPNIRSTLTGTDGDIGRAFQAYLYSGPIAYSLIATLDPNGPPAFSDPRWKKCLGGWTSSYQNCNLAHCGGTLYWWNRWDGEGTPWVNNGTTNPPARVNHNLSWDLGSYEDIGSNMTNLRVYVYAVGTRGYCDASKPGNYVTAAAGFSLPQINICPPEIEQVEMTKDICEYTVGAKLTVSIPHLGTSGVDLNIEWVASDSTNPSSWAGAQSTVVSNVSEDSTITVDLGNESLIPNTKYCFRLWLSKGNLESEKVISCNHSSLQLPDPEWVVPEFTEEECSMLEEGDCIPEFNSENVAELQC